MNEHAPKQESLSPVPEYIFDKKWQDAPFIMNPKSVEYAEKKQKFFEWSNYGVMHLEENKTARAILLARVAAMDAYDKAMEGEKMRYVKKTEANATPPESDRFITDDPKKPFVNSTSGNTNFRKTKSSDILYDGKNL